MAEAMAGGVRASTLALVGGVIGLAWVRGGRVRGAVELTVVERRIAVLDVVGDAQRLARLDVVPLSSEPRGASRSAPLDPS